MTDIEKYPADLDVVVDLPGIGTRAVAMIFQEGNRVFFLDVGWFNPYFVSQNPVHQVLGVVKPVKKKGIVYQYKVGDALFRKRTAQDTAAKDDLDQWKKALADPDFAGATRQRARRILIEGNFLR